MISKGWIYDRQPIIAGVPDFGKSLNVLDISFELVDGGVQQRDLLTVFLTVFVERKLRLTPIPSN
jgi:hypothetical protein